MLFLGSYLKEKKSVPQRYTCTPLLTVFITAKTCKQSKCLSTDEYRKYGVYGYIYICIYTTKYYSALRKEILPFVTTWMNPENVMLNEISRIQKDKCCMISLT